MWVAIRGEVEAELHEYAIGLGGVEAHMDAYEEVIVEHAEADSLPYEGFARLVAIRSPLLCIEIGGRVSIRSSVPQGRIGTLSSEMDQIQLRFGRASEGIERGRWRGVHRREARAWVWAVEQE